VHVSSCGNRYIQVFKDGGLEHTITTRDTNKMDMYSREEIYRMYVLVLKEGARTGWYPWPSTSEEREYDIQRMNQTAGISGD
jgi:hypothetical protein